MQTFRKILIIALALLLAIALSCTAIAGTFLLKLERRSAALADDCSQLAGLYPDPVQAGPQEPMTQTVSDGCAVIAQLGQWAGAGVTEADPDPAAVSTVSGFCAQLERVLPGYRARARGWLTDSEVIRTVYENLQAGLPVPIRWAAREGDGWALRYALVVAMDLPRDRITVLDPCGLREVLTQAEFSDRTSFRAWDNMPLGLKTAFALDVYQKNTLIQITAA